MHTANVLYKGGATWMFKGNQMADESGSDLPGSRPVIRHYVCTVPIRGIRTRLAATPPDGGQVSKPLEPVLVGCRLQNAGTLGYRGEVD
jgi:hypothetical protein